MSCTERMLEPGVITSPVLIELVVRASIVEREGISGGPILT